LDIYWNLQVFAMHGPMNVKFNVIVSGIRNITGQLGSACSVYYISQDKKPESVMYAYLLYSRRSNNSLKIMF